MKRNGWVFRDRPALAFSDKDGAGPQRKLCIVSYLSYNLNKEYREATCGLTGIALLYFLANKVCCCCFADINSAKNVCLHHWIYLGFREKLPTYPSPKPTLSLTSHLGQNVGLGEGKVGSFPGT